MAWVICLQAASNGGAMGNLSPKCTPRMRQPRACIAVVRMIRCFALVCVVGASSCASQGSAVLHTSSKAILCKQLARAH